MSHRRDAGTRRPLIAHVVYRFDVGGMENGLVNLINRLPEDLADHCVIALTEANPAFAARIDRPNVRVIGLGKPPGQLLWFLPTLLRRFRALRPTIVHTRNVGTLEAQLAAWAAGVPIRLHGEHGWDVGDLAGENRRLLMVRRLMRRFVHHQVALSTPTLRYLVDRVGVPASSVSSICNGVDVARFSPVSDREAARRALVAEESALERFFTPGAFVIGAVGRLAPVKNPALLVAAFAALRERNAALAPKLRLALVGDGPQEADIRRELEALGLASVTWLPGARSDVPRCMQCFDLLCVPSLAEGICNAILEAMASGLTVVATDVGGNAELIEATQTGRLVASGDVRAMADALEAYAGDTRLARDTGARARARAVTHFSLDAMIERYHDLYLARLGAAGFSLDKAPCVAHPSASA